MKKILLIFFFVIFMNTPGHTTERIEVFVSIAPIKWLVEKVGQERVVTRSLVATGQEPHSFDPTPKQIARLSRAKIWFTTDLEFEQQLHAKIANINKALNIIDITDNVTKLPMTAGEHHGEHTDDEQTGHGHEDANHHGNNDEAEHGHEDAHHHGHDDGKTEEHHHNAHHEHGEYDPHVWLSPLNLQIMADEIARALAAIDNEAAAFYQNNAQALHEELSGVHARVTTLLRPYAGTPFYVYHPSFGYFADTYGLEQRAVEVEGKAPTPRQLKQLIAQAKQQNMRVIFVQPQFDPKSANAIAQAINGNVVPLDPLHEEVTENLMTMAEKISSAMAK